jgi:hypothetical protein
MRLLAVAALIVVGVAVSSPDVSSAAGGGVVPVSPTRVVDTRGSSPVGAFDGSGAALRVDVSSVVPVGAVAVAANVTVVSAVAPPEGGFVTVFDCGVRPDVSSLNFRSGDTVANAVVAPVSADRAVCVYVYGVADVLVDVSGYVADGFAPVSPTRVVDTRGSSPVGAFDGSGAALRVDVSSVVPVGAVAVAANVTVVSAVAPPEGGFVTVFGCGVRPDVSSLNFRSGDTVANAVVAPVSADRAVCVYVYGVADVLVDVSGSFLDGVAPVEPTRVIDTRATPGAAVRGNGVIEVDVLGPLGRAPGTVAAAMVNLTVAETVGGTFGGYASVFPMWRHTHDLHRELHHWAHSGRSGTCAPHRREARCVCMWSAVPRCCSM